MYLMFINIYFLFRSEEIVPEVSIGLTRGIREARQNAIFVHVTFIR
jgi:hypothetical protein